MTKLVTMQGCNTMGHEFSLLKLMGNGEGGGLESVDPRTLSDQEAGVQLLYILAKNNPGLTWGDLFAQAQSQEPDGLSVGWNPFKNLGRKIKNLSTDTVNFIGDKSGSAIRLLTDKKVTDGITSYAKLAQGGAGPTSLAQSIFSKFLGGKQSQGLLQKLGQTNKVNYAAAPGGFGDMKINPYYVMAGVGGLLMLVLLSGGGSKK